MEVRGDEGADSLSSKIIDMISEELDEPERFNRKPLYEVIDVDALDALFAPTGRRSCDRTGSVTFSYCEFDITAWSDGAVMIRERAIRRSH